MFTSSVGPYTVRPQSAPWQYNRRQIICSNTRTCSLSLSVTMRTWNHKVNSVRCGALSLSQRPTDRRYCTVRLASRPFRSATSLTFLLGGHVWQPC